mmetsp:Transcript_33095/g.63538  ORF Transcript_33095/g.63538 Transcript_33095/m.63538 type:complete len:409 (-) Transcript_33095:27-1253(-)
MVGGGVHRVLRLGFVFPEAGVPEPFRHVSQPRRPRLRKVFVPVLELENERLQIPSPRIQRLRVGARHARGEARVLHQTPGQVSPRLRSGKVQAPSRLARLAALGVARGPVNVSVVKGKEVVEVVVTVKGLDVKHVPDVEGVDGHRGWQPGKQLGVLLHRARGCAAREELRHDLGHRVLAEHVQGRHRSQGLRLPRSGEGYDGLHFGVDPRGVGGHVKHFVPGLRLKVAQRKVGHGVLGTNHGVLHDSLQVELRVEEVVRLHHHQVRGRAARGLDEGVQVRCQARLGRRPVAHDVLHREVGARELGRAAPARVVLVVDVVAQNKHLGGDGPEPGHAARAVHPEVHQQLVGNLKEPFGTVRPHAHLAAHVAPQRRAHYHEADRCRWRCCARHLDIGLPLLSSTRLRAGLR